MKHFSLLVISIFLLGSSLPATAQNPEDCNSSELFTPLSNHSLKECLKKEFENLNVYSLAKNKSRQETIHSGEYQKTAYAWNGEFSTRPSAAQIYGNYSAAFTKASGETLYNGPQGLFGKLKKNNTNYYIKVYTDGSGWYWVETLAEKSLRQDVVPTAAEIKTKIEEEGKAAFYGIYFDSGKTALKPESAPTLEALASFLKTNPGTRFIIVGHTDNEGTLDFNMQLSAGRANAVMNELINAYGIAKDRLQAKGIGYLSPVAGNDTEEGRARNRRVEIVKTN